MKKFGMTKGCEVLRKALKKTCVCQWCMNGIVIHITTKLRVWFIDADKSDLRLGVVKARAGFTRF